MKNLINEINETAEKIDGIIKTLYETNNLTSEFQLFKNDILKTIEKYKKLDTSETAEKKQTEKQANSELLNENNGLYKQLGKEQKAELKKLFDGLRIETADDKNGKNYKVLLNSEQLKTFKVFIVECDSLSNNKLKSIICDSIVSSIETKSTETAEKSRQKVFGELKPNHKKLFETINLNILRNGLLWNMDTHELVNQTSKPNIEN